MLAGHLPAEPRVGRAQPGGGVLGLSWDTKVFRWGALIPGPSSERSVQGKAGGRMCRHSSETSRYVSEEELNLKVFSQKNTIWKTAARGVVRVPDPFLGFECIPWSTWHIENAR